MHKVITVNPSQDNVPVVRTSWQNLPPFSYGDPNVFCTPLVVGLDEASFLLWGPMDYMGKPVLLHTKTGNTSQALLGHLAEWSIYKHVFPVSGERGTWRRGTLEVYNYCLDLSPLQVMTPNTAGGFNSKSKSLTMPEALAYVAASKGNHLDYLMIKDIKSISAGLGILAETALGESLLLSIPQGYGQPSTGALSNKVGQAVLCEYDPSRGVLYKVFL